jgi:endonuclease YncB( thermonuclease family)
MTRFRYLFGVVLICLSTFTGAEEFSGKVVAVMDGDTLLVIRDGHPVKVRLAEIDAPEKLQPFGIASKKSLAEMVKGKQVRVMSRAVDDYGRLIAKVYVGDVNVNHEQVRRGMAWEYSRYHSNRDLMDLQREAQQAKRGLWAEPDAVEPSAWRKQHPGSVAVVPDAASSSTPAASASLDQSPRTSSAQACGKKHCSEMDSCGEAKRNLSLCGQRSLDGDADGKPCERLCAGAGEKPGSVQ